MRSPLAILNVTEIFPRQCDVEPDRITYSTLIKGYCVAGPGVGEDKVQQNYLGGVFKYTLED